MEMQAQKPSMSSTTISADPLQKQFNQKKSLNLRQKPKHFTKKPLAKKSVPSRPVVYVYTSVCCGLPARKPPAFQKVDSRDAESSKVKSVTSGFGKWKCSGCQRKTKVTRSKVAA